MFNLKVLFLAFLLLAADALAARVIYSGNFAGSSVSTRTQKATVVDDAKAEAILENIATWSNGEFTASKGRTTGIVTVVNVEAAASKGKASELVQNMQAVVSENYRPAARSPSPTPASRPHSPAAHKLRRRSPRFVRSY